MAFLDSTHLTPYDQTTDLWTFVKPRNSQDWCRATVMAVKSADDQINPPELHIVEREIGKVKHAKFVLLPITSETRGHGTHTLPLVWYKYLAQLLTETAH